MRNRWRREIRSRDRNKISLCELLSKDCLDRKPRSGRPKALTDAEIDHLVLTVKSTFRTRQMWLVDIRREAGLGHVSDSTVWKALRSRGIKAYREMFKFILKSENKVVRLKYCMDRKEWGIEEWKNYGFTDEMSIEVGGLFGLNLVWQDKTEKWHDDCVGCMKKQGESVMCWGMIGWGWKGPFYVWEIETSEEREEAALAIALLEEGREAEEKRLNEEWKASEEWEDLRTEELAAFSAQRYAEKHNNPPKQRVPQTYRGKKFKLAKYKRGEGRGIDSWRYVKCVARPLLWPTCRERLSTNASFVLMEDNVPAHDSIFTNARREKEGIEKVDWPANSPDFNPIEHIWMLMKSRIQTRRGHERVTSLPQMKLILQEEWDRITIEDINKEVAKLPSIITKCINVYGGNNYHA